MIHRDSQVTQPLSPQIGRRRGPTNFSRHVFVPRPSRSFAVLLVLTAHVFTYRSSHSPTPIQYFIPLLVISIPASLRLFKHTSQQRVLCVLSHTTANTVSSENDIDHGAVDQPSGVVAARTHTSLSLAHQSFIAWRIHVRCAWFSDSPHGPAVTRPLHSSTRELVLMNRSQFASLR